MNNQFVVTQIEHFQFKEKLYFKYYSKEELRAVVEYTVCCGVNTHLSSKKKKKQYHKCKKRQ